MRAEQLLKSSFSKLFVTSLIVGLGACSSKKAPSDEIAFEDAAMSEVAVDVSSGDAAAPTVADAAASEEAAATHNDTAARATVSHYSGSHKVEVQTSPFEHEGFLLNGVYFVRGSEESWSSLSQKLYGRPDRDNLLKQWNKGRPLNVGSVIYYNSPSRPEDRAAMKPFAMDFGSSLEKHVVQPGESLSLIAQRMYGNAMSWKEISALNPDIQNPDLIQIGQNIVIQPKDVDSQAFLASLLNQTEQTPPTAAVETAPETTPETMAQAEVAPPAPEMAAPEPVMDDFTPPPAAAQPEIVSKRPERKAENAFLSWFNFMKGDDESSNLFLVGIVLILGALLFLVVNNRRKAAKRHQEELDNLTDFERKTGSQD